MPATTYASDRMNELVSAATVALAVTRSGNTLPTRILRTHNQPVVPVTNCADSLSVYLANPAIRLRQVSQGRAVQSGPVFIMPILRMFVELWRCVPGLGAAGEEPTDTALNTSAGNLANDVWALWTGLKQQIDAGTAFTGLGIASAPQGVLPMLGDPIPLGPQGRMGGFRILVETPTSDLGPP